jgi:hypothetical protein
MNIVDIQLLTQFVTRASYWPSAKEPASVQSRGAEVISGVGPSIRRRRHGFRTIGALTSLFALACCSQPPEKPESTNFPSERILPPIAPIDCRETTSVPPPWEVLDQSNGGLSLATQVESFGGTTDPSRPSVHNRITAEIGWGYRWLRLEPGETIATRTERLVTEGRYVLTQDSSFVLPGFQAFTTPEFPQNNPRTRDKYIELVRSDNRAVVECHVGNKDPEGTKTRLAYFCDVYAEEPGQMIDSRHVRVPTTAFRQIPEILHSLNDVAATFERGCTSATK